MNNSGFYKEQIKRYAKTGGWKISYEKEPKELIGFYNQEHRCHLEVYVRSMHVITCLKHPSSGHRTLYRNNVGLVEIKKIFDNPRTHTGKGVYKINKDNV